MALLNNGGLGLGILLYAEDLASGAMSKVEAKFRELEGTSKQTADALSRNLGMMKAGVAGLAAGGGIIAGLSLVGKSAFQTAARFETYETTLTHLLGSSEKAKGLLTELAGVGRDTPFNREDLIQATKQMMAYGFEAERIPGIMTDIADAISVVGGGPDAINRMLLALGQMKQRAYVTGEEIKQLTELAIPVNRYLGEQLGLTKEQLSNIANLRLDPNMVIDAILRGIETSDWHGQAKVLADSTALGITSNIGDAFTDLLDSIGQGFIEDMKGILRDLRDTFGYLADTQALRGFGQGLGQLVGYLRAGVSGILSMARAVGDFFATRPQLLATITTFVGVGAAILTVVSAIAVARGAIGAATLMLRHFGIAGTVSFGSLLWPVLLITGAIMALKLAYERNFMGFRDFVNRARLVWKGLWSLISSSRLESGDIVGSLPQSLRDELAKAGLLDFTVQLGEMVVRARAFLSGLWQGIVGFGQGVRAVWGWIQPVFGAVGGVISWVTGLLARFGLWSARVSTAPDPSGWQSFGRVAGYVLAGILAPMAVIRGYKLAAPVWGLAKAILGLPGRTIQFVTGRFAALRASIILTRDSAIRLGQGLARGYGYVTRQLAFLRLRALLAAVVIRQRLPAVLSTAAQRAVGFGRSLLAAGRAAFLSGLQFLMSPWGVALLVITALAAGAYLLIKYWGPIKAFFKNLWSGIKDAFRNAWEGIREFAPKVWESIRKFAAKVPDWVLVALTAFAPFIGLPLLIAKHWDKIRDPRWLSEVLTMIPRTLSNLGRQTIDGLRNAILGAGESIKQAGWALWDWLTSPLRNAVQNALEWGRNLVGNIVQGLKDKINEIKQSAGALAGKIADFLGFSSPTRLGPGSTADRWMPNLVGMLVAGLIAGQGTVAGAAGDLAATVQQELSRPVAGPMVRISQPELTTIPALQVGVAQGLTATVRYATIGQPSLPGLATIAQVRWATPEWQAPDLAAQARVSWATESLGMPPIAAMATEEAVSGFQAAQVGPATGMVTMPQSSITPVSWPTPAAPSVVVQTPVTTQGQPGLQKQAEMLQPIQLVLDGRVIAETIARIKADDEARSFRY